MSFGSPLLLLVKQEVEFIFSPLWVAKVINPPLLNSLPCIFIAPTNHSYVLHYVQESPRWSFSASSNLRILFTNFITNQVQYIDIFLTYLYIFLSSDLSAVDSESLKLT